jgi:PEP-CTERM motif
MSVRTRLLTATDETAIDAMAATHFPSPLMFPMAPMRRFLGVLLLSSAVGAAALLATPTTCLASLITYVFKDASTTLDGTPEVITGTFVFNPASTMTFSADIVLTGAAPYSDTYNRVLSFGNPSNVISASVTENPEPPSPRNLIITFADPLGTTADPIQLVQWYPGPQDDGYSGATDANPAGYVVPVPEASTWAMMLLGFVGLGFAGYRKSRRPAASAA